MSNGRAGKLTTKEIKAILTLHQRDISQQKIANKFHIDRSTVHYHLEKNGVVLRHRNISIRCNKHKEEGAFVYQDYLKKNKERTRKMIINVLRDKNARKCVDLDSGKYVI